MVTTVFKESRTVDVLFVNPPSPDGLTYIRDIDRSGRYSRENTIWPQANLAYLAAALDDRYKVDIIDCIAEKMSWPEFESLVLKKKPKYIVTNVISSIVSNDMYVADVGKKMGAQTIAIGPHVTALPDETLRDSPKLDYLILGEAEESLRELIDSLEDGTDLKRVKGIGFRSENGSAVITEKRPPIENLDDLPYPRHDLLPLDRYNLPLIGKRYTFVMTSRGCPFNCTFCRSPVMWGKKVRKRSPDNIIGELKVLKNLGVKNIIFHSDTFTLDKNWTIELCRKMVDEQLEMRWMANSRANTIDKEMLQWMKKAGCWMVAYGFESGSQKILDNVKKEITLDQIKKAAQWTKDAGIGVWGYFIIGLPGETKETIDETIRLAKELPLDLVNFAVGAPYPGTGFFEYVEKNGYLLSKNWEDFDQNYSAIVSYENLQATEITAGIQKAYREYYLRPTVFAKFLGTIKSFHDLKVLFATGYKHLRMMYGYDR
jgi:radical SAM superfamily enzyme YgiQ (UPF0313 family)